MRLKQSCSLVFLLTLIFGLFINVSDVKAETAYGNLVLTNWYKPNELNYNHGKYYNPYVQSNWSTNADPVEIGHLEHILKKKNDDGTYTQVDLDSVLPVGEYQLLPSSIGGNKKIDIKEFTIEQGKETVVDLVYTMSTVSTTFVLEDSSNKAKNLNNVAYEVYNTKIGGDIDQKIYNGTASNGEINILTDPGAYAIKIGTYGWIRFVAYAENPEVTQQLDIVTLTDVDKVTTINGSSNQGTSNNTTGTTNTVSSIANESSAINSTAPPTSEQARTLMYIPIVIILSLGVFVTWFILEFKH